MNDLLTAALDAAERGWPVFMLGRSKRPVANCDDCPPRRARPGDLRAPDLPRVLRRHHRPRPRRRDRGRRPGRAARRPDRCRVRAGGGRRGPRARRNASLAELVAHELVPRTLWVRTGSGGVHLYYRHPGREIGSRPMPNRAGIDVKADGGYVVLPPSIHHRTHQPYRWGDGTARTDARCPPRSSTPACPPAPADSATRPAGADPDHPSAGASRTLRAAHVARSTPYATHPRASAERRSTALRRGVARMVAAGAIDHADAIAALTDVGQQVEQTARDIRAAIAGGFHDEGIAA